jgi:two-component system chemotaxis response regulator CheY
VWGPAGRFGGQPVHFEAGMKTCLVIDDSEVVRKVACQIFQHLQFETSEAESGQEALDGCSKAMPDAILLDSHIPSMGTVEFLSSLRALANGNKPIVIYCSAENNSSEIMRALSAGADDYVLKPFDRESLRAKLAATGLV